MPFEALVQSLAPAIEGQPPDNLVLASAYQADAIEIHIPGINTPPPGFGEFIGNERFSLVYNGIEATDVYIRLEDPDDPSSPLVPDTVVFHLPTSNLGPEQEYRTIEFQYTLHYEDGQDPGPVQRISFDTLPPAHDKVQPDGLIVSADIIRDGITGESFKKEGEEEFIEAIVPAYAGEKAGDIIRGYIAGEGSARDEVIGQVAWGDTDAVVVRFARGFIERFDDGMHDFSYRIEAREGLLSGRSTPLQLRILLKDFISDLGEPGVPAYDGDTGRKLVDEQDARNALEVRIPEHAKITTDHSLKVMWGAFTSTEVRIVDPANIRVVIPYTPILNDWIARNPTGSDSDIAIEVKYEIFKGTTRVGRSPSHGVEVNLHVAGGADPDPGTEPNDNLSTPIVRPRSGEEFDNKIPLKDYGRDATILIDKQTKGTVRFIAGDAITCRYNEETLDSYAVTAGDLENPAEPLSIILPTEIIEAAGGGVNHVSYWVERALAGGGRNTSKSPVQEIAVESEKDLPGEGNLDQAILPEVANFIIGLKPLLDGTPLALPTYKNFHATDKIVVYAAMVKGSIRQHADDETPVAGFGAQPTDPDQKNRFELPTPLEIRDADSGPVDEPGSGTRPPIDKPHILTRIPVDRFPNIGSDEREVFHTDLYYTVTNAVGTVSSKIFRFTVDPRGSKALVETTQAGGPDSLAWLHRTVTDKLHQLQRLIERFPHHK